MTKLNPQDFKRASVNLETARIAWKELQRYFAKGVAISVSAELDLIEVAYQISEDNKAQVAQWLTAARLAASPMSRRWPGTKPMPTCGPWWSGPMCWCRTPQRSRKAI